MAEFSFLKKSLADFAQTAQKKADKLESKKRELANITSLPLPRQDVVDGICKMLDTQALCYPKKLAVTLRGVIDNPEFDFENSQLDLISSSGGAFQPGMLPKQNALWFLGEVIKGRITDAIQQMPYPDEVGLSLTKRKPLIAKLEAEIKQLETEAAELQTQAKALNITIPAPLSEREEKAAFTKEVMRLTTVTPFPDHAIRQMLIDGKDPEKEALKIKQDAVA